MVNKSTTSRCADTEYTMLTQHPHRPRAGQTVLAGHQPVSGILISFSSCQHSNPAMGPHAVCTYMCPYAACTWVTMLVRSPICHMPHQVKEPHIQVTPVQQTGTWLSKQTLG